MKHLVHEYKDKVIGDDGRRYGVSAYASERPDGTWVGWLEFDADGIVLRTGRETTQPEFHALEYWAEGIEPIYLEGALVRAERRDAAEHELAMTEAELV
jgi:hypothetical protein